MTKFTLGSLTFTVTSIDHTFVETKTAADVYITL